jgi:hypothetical protein
MADQEKSEQQSTTDGAGAKKRRRRRGKRRPAGEQSQDQSQESNAKEASPEKPASGEATDTRPSRRRRPKRPTRPERSDNATTDESAAGEKSDTTKNERAKRSEKAKARPKRGSVLERRRSTPAAELEFPDEPELMPAAPSPTAKTVDAYVKQLRGWQREAVIALRNIVRSLAGEAEEQILWSQPVFTLNGPVCYIKAFSDHVNIGFWRGNELDDPDELLTGELQTMRHVSFYHMNEVNRDAIESFVAQAFKLSKEKGDPTGV